MKQVNVKQLRSENQYALGETQNSAIIVEDGSVIVNPQFMRQDEFYPANVNGTLFLYRRVGVSEIEVYELVGEV